MTSNIGIIARSRNAASRKKTQRIELLGCGTRHQMQVFVLYTSVVLVWGSTWIAIAYQLGPVAEEWSIAYRFAIASAVLFAFAALGNRSLRIPRNSYPMVIVQGLFLFSLNYLFVYRGTHFITTGLVAVVFSLIILFNAVFERIFFKVAIEGRFALAAVCGLTGIALVFWPEIAEFSLQDRVLAGVLLIVVSVASASLGNMAAIYNLRKNLPVVSLNAHAMAWGAMLSALNAAISGRTLTFSTEPAYVWSLLYLAVFGSALAFGCMLILLRKIGAARTAYTSVLFPIVALIISTQVEDYRWTAPAFAGVALALLGNWLALTKKKTSNNN